MIALPAVVQIPSTVVTDVYPAGDVIPENLLRMYVQFSGPMGQQGGLDHVVLLDARGREMPDALLPLDTELWNGDRTRFTLLFDPGRVKTRHPAQPAAWAARSTRETASRSS